MRGKIRIGIELIDKCIPKGFPKDSLVVIHGPPGVGKTIMLRQILSHRLLNGDYCIVICLENPPLSFLKSLSEMNIDVDLYIKKRKLFVFDCFSHLIKHIPIKPTSLPECIIRVDDPLKFDKLLVMVYELIERLGFSANGCVFVDTFTELLFSKDVFTAINWLKSLRALFAKTLGLLTVVTHHTHKQFEVFDETIPAIADVSIKVRYNPILLQKGMGVREFMVEKVSGAPNIPIWVPFLISSKGVIPYPVKEHRKKPVQQ
ncbi:hypothetical protein DRO21_04385 [archaeon]|nr:MAG: hypothetical protein DRO21_04385 [archaeon]HDM23719.1 hypothetical protein [Candidatus Bathyarchaeota archaeon]